VIGAHFYVMEWVEGTVVDSPEIAVNALATTALRTRAAEDVVDRLAALHRLDVDAIGLGGLGPRENYIVRQLERMRGVWEKTKTRELPLVESLYKRLMAARPAQLHTGLVHSDYRLGNILLDAFGKVVAVLDWELCALGDVLVDLGFLVNSWDGPNDLAPGIWMREAPTRTPGFPSREQIVARYVQQSGFDVSNLSYYRAFCYWRLAVIGEGVKRRYESGAMGGASVNVAAMIRRIQGRLELADHFLQSSGA
jgi:aminoglycoside phosphotransferase (APT) family kinase protein